MMLLMCMLPLVFIVFVCIAAARSAPTMPQPKPSPLSSHCQPTAPPPEGSVARVIHWCFIRLRHLAVSVFKLASALLMQLAYFQAGKVALVLIVFAASQRADVMGWAYIMLAVITLLHGTRISLLTTQPPGQSQRRFDRVWLPFFYLTVIFWLAKFLYQGSYFSGSSAQSTASWWGLQRVDGVILSRWGVFKQPFQIIVIVYLLRWTSDFAPVLQATHEREKRRLRVRTFFVLQRSAMCFVM